MTFQRFTEPVIGKDGKQLMNPPEYQGGKEKPVEKKHMRPWCIGDGATAKRRMEDGAVREVPCQLIGNGDAATVCPWSANGSCKAMTTLAVTLAVERNGRLEPLTRIKGVRHRIETKSPHNGASFLRVLDTVADKLDGNIGGIDGTIRFSKVSTVYSNAGKPSETKVGRVTIGLNPFSIEARLDAMRQARGYYVAAPEPTALLSTPQDDAALPDDDAPNPGEDMAPPLQPGEPSRGEAINAGLEAGHDVGAAPADDPLADPPPAPLPTALEIGKALAVKFKAARITWPEAQPMIETHGRDQAKIESALDQIIKAEAEAAAEIAAEGAGA
jgi:hypothetical protein